MRKYIEKAILEKPIHTHMEDGVWAKLCEILLFYRSTVETVSMLTSNEIIAV